jgi:hypothetical protein
MRIAGYDNMTFKYAVTLPISGSHKLKRFVDWAAASVPGLAYKLPPQTPIKTETMTVRLSSLDDRQRVLSALATSKP